MIKLRPEVKIELRNLISKINDVIYTSENIIEDHFPDYEIFLECSLTKAIDAIRMDNSDLLKKLENTIKNETN